MVDVSALAGKATQPLLALLALALLTVSAARANNETQWRPEGTLAVPPFAYSFLAATPRGDLLAATFNSSNPGDPPMELPALLIRNPTSARPEVVELSRHPFEPQRGYGGIASDADGNYFVSGDTGEASTSFVRKFREDGTPDRSFANGGVLRPGRRCMGLEVLGDFLLVTADWGQVLVFDAETGRPIGATARPPRPIYVRDIAIDPRSMRIFGVAQGGVVTWGRAAPWEASNYYFRPISQSRTEPRAGEGISVDPFRRTVLITPVRGNTLLEIEGSGRVTRTVVTTADSNAHLCDNVISFDGTVLFVSDILDRKIHVLRRPLPQEEPVVARATPRTTTDETTTDTGETAPRPTWHRSYTDVVQMAREENRPMIVYFRRPDFDPCTELEREVLLTNEFNRRAQNFVCVFEDVTRSRLLAYRFGAHRIPHLVILDPQGETLAEFSFDIPADALFAAMEAAN